jgi:multidrug efflux system membrane fusion protein
MNRNRDQRLHAGVAFAALLVIATGCGETAAPELPAVVRPVKTTVVGGVQSAVLSFPGTTQASDRSVLSFRVAGPLIELPVNEGDPVEKGDLLARIDTVDFEIKVAEARAAYQKAVADYDRFNRLYEREAVPLADVELHRAMRDVAEAQLRQAEVNLGYTWLRAPYGGWVGRKFVENFESVLAREKILTLQNLSLVEIVVNVPENIMAQVGSDRNPEIVARFATAPGREFPLTFRESTAEADVETQTFQVTLSMPQPDVISVLPGMTAQVLLRTTASAEEAAAGVVGFAIPALAVFADEQSRAQVWVVETAGMTVHRRPVEIGEPTGSREVWVLSGLEAGETIAVTAVQELVEGNEIRYLPESY